MRAAPPALAAFASILLLSACSENFGGAGTGDGATGADSGSSELGGSGAASQLPSLEGEISPGGCEELSGKPLGGVSAWFLGTYEIESGDRWVGEEEWRLYANDTCTANGSSDCVVVWTTTASETSPGECTTCDMGLAVSAQIDMARTTCPSGLYVGEETWSTTYGIKFEGSGTEVSWYFAASNTYIGHGYAVGAPSAMNFITDRTCEWVCP
ncbi:MAG: hypothetical protein D6798_00040 [Deltaproteobacteria bacterium]|nr:MAG: hypothetical protein D6798_00040 [Deltaproteobacteria bacterium]